MTFLALFLLSSAVSLLILNDKDKSDDVRLSRRQSTSTKLLVISPCQALQVYWHAIWTPTPLVRNPGLLVHKANDILLRQVSPETCKIYLSRQDRGGVLMQNNAREFPWICGFRHYHQKSLQISWKPSAIEQVCPPSVATAKIRLIWTTWKFQASCRRLLVCSRRRKSLLCSENACRMYLLQMMQR